MKIVVAGSGKLAQAILAHIDRKLFPDVAIWEDFDNSTNQKIVLVHAGSGRQVADCVAYCQRTLSVLVEVATGSVLEGQAATFPLLVCPNTSLLLVKLMYLLSQEGHFFHHDPVTILESHQAEKKSVAGTALSFAASLNVAPENIQSIRDPDIQASRLGITPEGLRSHAFHRISIDDGSSSITMETRVEGHLSYVRGLEKILAVINSHQLENRPYSLDEFIRCEWI